MLPQPPAQPDLQSPPSLRWHVYCNVVDNFGDVGVAWRLCCSLANSGQQVRLCVDDASALTWMAPQGHSGVELVTGWALPGFQFTTDFDIIIECFGCNLDILSITNNPNICLGSNPDKLWINLEYLSAENYVLRSHGLGSPPAGPNSTALAKYFFYPGFVEGTGGLLREANLALRQASFDRNAWLQNLSTQCETASQFTVEASHPERLVSLFCYEPAALLALLNQLAHGPKRTRLLVTHGRASAAAQSEIKNIKGWQPNKQSHGQLTISYLPRLSQMQFDELLWACDLNFVRGEDSVVRALWAGKPFVWQIYPQDDDAHHAKLAAFLQWLKADAGLSSFYQVWNGIRTAALPALDLAAWASTARQARARLLQQADLCSQLLDFVAEKRKNTLK